MKLDPKYLCFYLEGRTDDPLDDDDVDLDDLVDKIADGGGDTPYTVAHGVAVTLAAPLKHDREKRQWIADNKEEIAEAGGDSNLAYEHYILGRTDAYASILEGEIVDALLEADDDDDEDDDDDD